MLLSALAGALLVATTTVAHAENRTVFAGCVVERTNSTIILKTDGDEIILIDTSWVVSTMADALSADCLTVKTLTVDGRYVAESVEAGDEPNEVNSLTNETTRDRR